MADGTSTVNNKVPGQASTAIEEAPLSPQAGLSEFKRVFKVQAHVDIAGDLRNYFRNLAGLTQSASLTSGQRLEAFRLITEQIIASPSNPYSKIESDLRKEMIESVADVLADSPLSLPRVVSRVPRIA
jgi:hypothetical protein